jgi:hypothetical protein
MNMSKCKYCGREIVWITSRAERPLPCDPHPRYFVRRSKGAQKLVILSGEVVTGEFLEDVFMADGDREEIGRVAHFASCPGFKAGRSNPDRPRAV